MYVKLSSNSGQQAVITVSKTDSVASLKAQVEKEFGIPKSKQRLIYGGKQLEDGHTLFDYKINVNNTIQVMERPDIDVSEQPVAEAKEQEAEVPCSSPYFRIGDVVDAVDATHGAWFEAKVSEIVKCPPDDEIYYKVLFTTIPSPPTLVSLKAIRPVSRNPVSIASLKANDIVMVNYNPSNPDDRGYWYDMKVKRIINNENNITAILGTLYVGVDRRPIDDVQIISPDDIMGIFDNKLLSERLPEELALLATDTLVKRKTAPLCSNCKDNPRRKCRQCGCEKCGGKDDPDKQLVCDECEHCYHIGCLNPPLAELPDCDEWYCNDCKNDDGEVVKAGEKLKLSSKKAKMASASTSSKRDWGRGMACVGRTKECTMVQKNHFGPIPGVEVGSLWKYRFQVSESGVHRPHVAGIHGRDTEGAFSITLSGGYEDDVDNGEEFLYTGSGGRDLSGNKRTAEQSCDQKLTRMNKALALNCNAKLDATNGAEAKNWKNGKPVRVVRNCKLRKHSKYAPKEGNRYDGIYKVVKYYPVKGQKGFLVWRYVLRRDDPIPAPWTKEGKERIASLGISMQYPDSYLDAMRMKAKPGEKRTLDQDIASTSVLSPAKKLKITYKLDKGAKRAIDGDKINAKLWATLQSHISSGQKAFLDKVEEEFTCVCCMGLVYQPVTTPCSHNICEECLKRSYFEAKITTCPSCRTELGADYKFAINKNLGDALQCLFPGYMASR